MKEAKKATRSYCAVVLHNVRSMQNVGSIFRTADAAGINEIILTGYTPLPVDRFGRESSMIKKTALGAQKTVSWRHEDDIKKVLDDYRKREVETMAVEQHSSAGDYRALKPSTSRAFVFGNEVDGIPDEVIAACSRAVEIPLFGKKESLNVAVAVGIILFQNIN